MLRISALASLLLLAACASTPPVLDGPTALNGKDLNTATGLYGPYDERVVLAGRENYIWRRAVILGGKTYYCELRAQTGFRDNIATTVQEGYPSACALFSVQYKNFYGPAADDVAKDTSKRVAERKFKFRPVPDRQGDQAPVELSSR